MTNEEWDGVDRRAGDERRSAMVTAVSEVRGLKESVLVLAQAVGQTMTRHEVIVGVHRTTRLLIANVILLIANVILNLVNLAVR